MKNLNKNAQEKKIKTREPGQMLNIDQSLINKYI